MDVPDLVTDGDGVRRCGWSVTDAAYMAYHDAEWGRPVHDERRLYEKLCLEGFQSGLSWRTILRKRPAFRAVFVDFDARLVAAFTADDVERLMADARIIRHRGKIEATVAGARALLAMHAAGETLADLAWSFAPRQEAAPTTMADVPSVTPESTALATALRRRGFRFLGPTTVYAFMQAMGLVNDHLAGCTVGQELRTAVPVARPQARPLSGSAET